MEYFDALIVGSGAAGLYTALNLPRDWRVALLTKEDLRASSSDWAQGGIAAVIDPTDSFLLHTEDTMVAGAGLCERQAVEVLVEEAPERIAELIHLGVSFDRYQGRLDLTLEAAHSRKRILHAQDATGRELVRALTEEVLVQPNITIYEKTLVTDLWVARGRCWGVRTRRAGVAAYLGAPVTVLATGGASRVFLHSTNPPVCTGDGLAMAWLAGARLRDMEFVQFHPTALAVPGAPRLLISEAVRGEGAHVLDRQGQRFLSRYHPAGELAPRDVVARAIYLHLRERGEDRVFIDFRPVGQQRIEQRFPNIRLTCAQYGLDIFEEPIPVAPAAHYCMGGVQTDLLGQTSVPGLWAVGETASTGVHGANRLASNSLLECLVFAHRIGRHTGLNTLNYPPPPALVDQAPPSPAAVQTILRQLPVLCWEACGIVRTALDLERGLAQLRLWQEWLAQADWTLDREALEARNQILVAYLLLQSALWRRESRGAHFRSDFPETALSWQVHTVIEHDHWSAQALKPDPVVYR
ncbi:L-aspartate oxidase [Anthocerotibacter panamensis]|uniref:L-aspartate oxidase n=1 Tax=Anthocerotibacter panamensis TaxID=2857077 RepID=UPI001C406068|nr:L-aspartate oxidase [Anthocerotibacter panamensis]